MEDIYKNIDEDNIDKERKILIVFDDMIADMIYNKRLNLIVAELFIRGRKINISIVFITLRFQKMLDWMLLTFLTWKFQIKEDFNKLH